MIKLLRRFIVLIIIFSLIDCHKETQIKNRSEDTLIQKNDSAKTGDQDEEHKEPDEDPAYTFPKTGRSAEDFITEPEIFEIQYETKGDLNGDGLEDIAFVRKEKKGKYGNRTAVILIQNSDKTFRPDKISDLVMPNEYAENDFKIYDNEEITIKNGELKIQLYSAGPAGNLFSTFRYSGGDFLLTHIETYNVGAGSHLSLNYDLPKGELTEEVINTMKEDMPSESKIYKIKKEQYKFENVSPDELIQNVYGKAGNQ